MTLVLSVHVVCSDLLQIWCLIVEFNVVRNNNLDNTFFQKEMKLLYFSFCTALLTFVLVFVF